MPGAWASYLAETEDRHLQELIDFLRIPSVSALPQHAGDVEAAAAWVADRLRAAGVPEVETLTEARSPVVIGRWRAGDDKPTALIYAHYDVQPPDPLGLWETPPFEPTLRDGRIYARGAGDDKAGLLIAITAVEALTRGMGAPPINLVFFFEGEEEIGSPSVPAVVRAKRERLACDFVISADGGMWGPDEPALTLSSKGMAGCQIDLRTANTDLHSGEYGAAVPNAAQAIARLVAGFHAPDGRVAIDGFYDRVRELSAAERAEIAAFPFDEAAFLAEIGVGASWGEAGYTALERRWVRPTLDMNGIWGGFQGDGAKTVTPSEAHAKITCRLVPDQDPVEIIRLIEQHVATHKPTGAEVKVTPIQGSARPFAIARDHPAMTAAGEVLRGMFHREPLLVRTGGTIPLAEVFQRELGADMVFFAWSLPDCNMHAPNEWFRLEDFRRGREGYCRLLTALGG